MAHSELSELLEFLKVHQPFTLLDEDAVSQYALTLSLSYHKKGTEILSIGASNATVYMIKSGAVYYIPAITI